MALASVVFYGAGKTHIYPVYFWVLFDGCSSGREWPLPPEGTARAEAFCEYPDSLKLLGDNAVLPSLQVRVVQASVQDTSMCIFSFEESSFPPGGAAAAAARGLGCCALVVQRVHHCCRSPHGELARHAIILRIFSCVFVICRFLSVLLRLEYTGTVSRCTFDRFPAQFSPGLPQLTIFTSTSEGFMFIVGSCT